METSTFYVLEEFKDERAQRDFILLNGDYGRVRWSFCFCFWKTKTKKKKILKTARQKRHDFQRRNRKPKS